MATHTQKNDYNENYLAYLKYSYTRYKITYAIYNVITYTNTTCNTVTNLTKQYDCLYSYITVTNYVY